MKKRTLSLILALLMVCSLMPVSAAADAPKSGTCGDNLTWTLDDAGVLTISGTGDMYNYGADAEGLVTDAPWTAYGEDVNSIVIESGVTSIGNSAFNCRNAKSVSIPNGVTSIGKHAFYNCGLTALNIPDSVTSIGDGAFCYCNFTEVNIPDSVKTIGDEAFSGCRSLASVTLPCGLTVINKGVFSYCTSLKSVVVPVGVKFIDRGAFANCLALESIYLPGALEEIEEFAFVTDNPATPIKNVYYAGTEAQWNNVTVGKKNDLITNTPIRCGVSVYPFTDVDPAGRHAPFAVAIQWAANEGITTGYGDGIFKPNAECSRAQVVTFLWRAAGSPAPKSEDNPFVDVSAKQDNGNDNPYYTAILWANENGITNGVDATHFAPSKTCTRAQVVTFLWRAEGQPEPASAVNPFVDVFAKQDNGNDNPFYVAILWAVGEGITNGTDKTHFSPNNTCTRAQVVTFIYRDIA